MSRAPWNKLLADGSQVPEWCLSNSGQVAQPTPDYSFYVDRINYHNIITPIKSSDSILIVIDLCIFKVVYRYTMNNPRNNIRKSTREYLLHQIL